VPGGFRLRLMSQSGAMVQMSSAKLARALVSLADAQMVGAQADDGEPSGVARRLVDQCSDVLRVEHASVLQDDGHGALRFMASSTEQAEVVELVQLQAGCGPSLDCFASGVPVTVNDLGGDDGAQRWPEFAAAATEMGIAAVHVVPLRLPDQQITGVVDVFSTAVDGLDDEVASLCHALTAAAAAGLFHRQELARRDATIDQLQTALTSRVSIEQAKGILAERHGIEPSQAFDVLRRRARSNRQSLRELAHAIVTGSPDPGIPPRVTDPLDQASMRTENR
jgi:ANTAR domain/GAF domain